MIDIYFITYASLLE